MYGTLHAPTKKLHLCGPLGTRRLRSMNEGLELLRHPSLSNVCFAFLTRANQFNIKFGIAFKPWRAWRWATLIMHDLCGVRTSNHDNIYWKQTLLEESILKKFVKKMKIWHILQGITL